MTTSNFGNTEGFGAPPVYKPAVWRSNNAARVELLSRFVGDQLHPGDELEVEVAAVELGGLAGYEFDLRFDPRLLEFIGTGPVQDNVFSGNPRGAIYDTQDGEGRVRVIGARLGKQWSAQGEGRLANLRFRVLAEDFDGQVALGEGVLLDPEYAPTSIQLTKSLAEWVLPKKARLEQNFPNPFNPDTAIPFAVPTASRVRLEVYNILGQKIRTLASGPMDAGFHTLVWNGRDDIGRSVGAGLYFYLLEAGKQRQTRKMLLVK
jgi:hypothetical protein